MPRPIRKSNPIYYGELPSERELCSQTIDLFIRSIKIVEDFDGSIRGKYFKLFDENPIVEESLLMWLEEYCQEPKGIEIPKELTWLIYLVGTSAFNDIKSMSSYFKEL